MSFFKPTDAENFEIISQDVDNDQRYEEELEGDFRLEGTDLVSDVDFYSGYSNNPDDDTLDRQMGLNLRPIELAESPQIGSSYDGGNGPLNLHKRAWEQGGRPDDVWRNSWDGHYDQDWKGKLHSQLRLEKDANEFKQLLDFAEDDREVVEDDRKRLELVKKYSEGRGFTQSERQFLKTEPLGQKRARLQAMKAEKARAAFEKDQKKSFLTYAEAYKKYALPEKKFPYDNLYGGKIPVEMEVTRYEYKNKDSFGLSEKEVEKIVLEEHKLQERRLSSSGPVSPEEYASLQFPQSFIPKHRANLFLPKTPTPHREILTPQYSPKLQAEWDKFETERKKDEEKRTHHGSNSDSEDFFDLKNKVFSNNNYQQQRNNFHSSTLPGRPQTQPLTDTERLHLTRGPFDLDLTDVDDLTQSEFEPNDFSNGKLTKKAKEKYGIDFDKSHQIESLKEMEYQKQAHFLYEDKNDPSVQQRLGKYKPDKTTNRERARYDDEISAMENSYHNGSQKVHFNEYAQNSLIDYPVLISDELAKKTGQEYRQFHRLDDTTTDYPSSTTTSISSDGSMPVTRNPFDELSIKVNATLPKNQPFFPHQNEQNQNVPQNLPKYKNNQTTHSSPSPTLSSSSSSSSPSNYTDFDFDHPFFAELSAQNDQNQNDKKTPNTQQNPPHSPSYSTTASTTSTDYTGDDSFNEDEEENSKIYGYDLNIPKKDQIWFESNGLKPSDLVELWILNGKTLREARELTQKRIVPEKLLYQSDPQGVIRNAIAQEAELLKIEQKNGKMSQSDENEYDFTDDDFTDDDFNTIYPPRNKKKKTINLAKKNFFSLPQLILQSPNLHPEHYKYLVSDWGFRRQVYRSFYAWLWGYLYPNRHKLQISTRQRYPQRTSPLMLPAPPPQDRNMNGIRVAHITDLHYFTTKIPTFKEFFTWKRMIGYGNMMFNGRLKFFDSDVRRDMLAKLDELEPDIVICTGDLTSTGLHDEFELAFKELEPLLNKYPFFIIPGNHDVYTPENEKKMPIHSRFISYMHKVIPAFILPRDDPEEFLKTVPNWDQLTPYEKDRLRQLHIDMTELEREKGLPMYKGHHIPSMSPVGDKHSLSLAGHVVPNSEMSRIITSTHENLILPEIQAQYPNLSMYLSTPFTRFHEPKANSSDSNLIVSTITNQQLAIVARQSWAMLPPRQLVYTQADIDKYSVQNRDCTMDTMEKYYEIPPDLYSNHQYIIDEDGHVHADLISDLLEDMYITKSDDELELKKINRASQFPAQNFPTTPNNNQVLIIGLNPCYPTTIGSNGNYAREQLEDLQRLLNTRKHVMNSNTAELTSSEPIAESTMPFIILATHYPVIDRTGFDYQQVHGFHGVKNNHQLLHILDNCQVKPGLILHGHDHLGSAVGIASQRNLSRNAINDYLYPTPAPLVDMPTVPKYNYDTDPGHLHCENDPTRNIYAPHNNRRPIWKRIWDQIDRKFKTAKWYLREKFSPSYTGNVLDARFENLHEIDVQNSFEKTKENPGYDFELDYTKLTSQNTFDADIPAIPPLFGLEFAYTPSISDVLSQYYNVYSREQLDKVDIALTLDDLQQSQVANSRELLLTIKDLAVIDQTVTREYLEAYRGFKKEAIETIIAQIASYCHTTLPLDLQSYLNGTLQPVTLVRPIAVANMNEEVLELPLVRQRLSTLRSVVDDLGENLLTRLRPSLQRITDLSWYNAERKAEQYETNTRDIIKYRNRDGEEIDYTRADLKKKGLSNSIFDSNSFDQEMHKIVPKWAQNGTKYNSAVPNTIRVVDPDPWGVGIDTEGLFYGDSFNPRDIQNYIASMVGGTNSIMIHDNFQAHHLLRQHFPEKYKASKDNPIVNAETNLRNFEHFLLKDVANNTLNTRGTEDLAIINATLENYTDRYKHYIKSLERNPYASGSVKKVNTMWGDIQYSPQFSMMLRQRLIDQGLSIEDLQRRHEENRQLIHLLKNKPMKGVLAKDWNDISDIQLEYDGNIEKYLHDLSKRPSERPIMPLFDAASSKRREILNMKLRYSIIKLARNTWMPNFLQRNTTHAEELLDKVLWPFAMKYNIDRDWHDELFQSYFRARKEVDLEDRTKFTVPLYDYEDMRPKWPDPFEREAMGHFGYSDGNDFTYGEGQSTGSLAIGSLPFNLYRTQNEILNTAKKLMEEQSWWDKYTLYKEGITRPHPSFLSSTGTHLGHKVASFRPGSLTDEMLSEEFQDASPPRLSDLQGYGPDQHAYFKVLYGSAYDLADVTYSQIKHNRIPQNVLDRIGMVQDVGFGINLQPMKHNTNLSTKELKTLNKQNAKNNQNDFEQDEIDTAISDSSFLPVLGINQRSSFAPTGEITKPQKVLTYDQIVAQSLANTRNFLNPANKLTESMNDTLSRNTLGGISFSPGNIMGRLPTDRLIQLATLPQHLMEEAVVDLQRTNGLSQKSVAKLVEERRQSIKNGRPMSGGTLEQDILTISHDDAPVLFTGGVDISGSFEHQFPHGLKAHRQLNELIDTRSLFEEWVDYVGTGLVDPDTPLEQTVERTSDFVSNKLFIPIKRGFLHHDQAKVVLLAAKEHNSKMLDASMAEIKNQRELIQFRYEKLKDKIQNEGYQDIHDYMTQIKGAKAYFDNIEQEFKFRFMEFDRISKEYMSDIDRVPSHLMLERLHQNRNEQLMDLYEQNFALGVAISLVDQQFPWLNSRNLAYKDQKNLPPNDPRRWKTSYGQNYLPLTQYRQVVKMINGKPVTVPFETSPGSDPHMYLHREKLKEQFKDELLRYSNAYPIYRYDPNLKKDHPLSGHHGRTVDDKMGIDIFGLVDAMKDGGVAKRNSHLREITAKLAPLISQHVEATSSRLFTEALNILGQSITQEYKNQGVIVDQGNKREFIKNHLIEQEKRTGGPDKKHVLDDILFNPSSNSIPLDVALMNPPPELTTSLSPTIVKYMIDELSILLQKNKDGYYREHTDVQNNTASNNNYNYSQRHPKQHPKQHPPQTLENYKYKQSTIIFQEQLLALLKHHSMLTQIFSPFKSSGYVDLISPTTSPLLEGVNMEALLPPPPKVIIPIHNPGSMSLAHISNNPVDDDEFDYDDDGDDEEEELYGEGNLNEELKTTKQKKEKKKTILDHLKQLSPLILIKHVYKQISAKMLSYKFALLDRIASKLPETRAAVERIKAKHNYDHFEADPELSVQIKTKPPHLAGFNIYTILPRHEIDQRLIFSTTLYSAGAGLSDNTLNNQVKSGHNASNSGNVSERIGLSGGPNSAWLHHSADGAMLEELQGRHRSPAIAMSGSNPLLSGNAEAIEASIRGLRLMKSSFHRKEGTFTKNVMQMSDEAEKLKMLRKFHFAYKYKNNGNSYVSGDYYSLEFQHFIHVGSYKRGIDEFNQHTGEPIRYGLHHGCIDNVIESEVPYTYPLF